MKPYSAALFFTFAAFSFFRVVVNVNKTDLTDSPAPLIWALINFITASVCLGHALTALRKEK